MKPSRLLVWAVLASTAIACGSELAPELPPGHSDRPEPEIELAFNAIELDETLERPSALAFIPGAERELLVLESRRRVAHLLLDGDRAELLGSFEVPDLYKLIDCGLNSLAFDPEFADNGYVYISLCVSVQSSGVFRFRFDPDDYAATAASMREVIVLGDENAEKGIHNAGSIGFDRDGVMWAAFGDKGDKAHAGDVADGLGKILKIVPNRDEDGEGNEPAADQFPENPAVFASGLRSPWRATQDRQDRLYVGDVGSDFVEEIDLIVPGGDYGWPEHEGPCREDCGRLRNPIVSWDRSDDHPYVLDDPDALPVVGRVVWVGLSYRDRGNDRYGGELTDRVLFGDMCVGFVRLMEVDDDGHVAYDVPVAHRPFLSGIDQAEDGYIYALSYGSCAFNRGTHPSGELFRVERAE